tara:strand:- start:658 stop:804 length:147 start_codon:yes stop_codon:yes gene_type:complete
MEDYESKFDKKLWRTGSSIVITIPIDTIEKLELKEGEIIEVAIRRMKK